MSDSLIGKCWGALVYVDRYFCDNYPKTYALAWGAKIAISAVELHKYLSGPSDRSFKVYRKSDCNFVQHPTSTGIVATYWDPKPSTQPIATCDVAQVASDDVAAVKQEIVDQVQEHVPGEYVVVP